MKPVELVGVANHEIHRTPFGTGRAQLEEYLHVTQIYARHRRRFTPGEGQIETELIGVEVDGSKKIADEQGRVMLLAVDLRGGWGAHRTASSGTEMLWLQGSQMFIDFAAHRFFALQRSAM
jgi:hypothetical protein